MEPVVALRLVAEQIATVRSTDPDDDVDPAEEYAAQRADLATYDRLSLLDWRVVALMSWHMAWQLADDLVAATGRQRTDGARRAAVEAVRDFLVDQYRPRPVVDDGE